MYFFNRSKNVEQLDVVSSQLFSILSISKDAIIILENINDIVYINDTMSNMLRIKENQKTLFESDMPNIYIKGTQKRFREFIQDYYKPDPNELSYFPQLHIETRRLGKVAVDLFLGNRVLPKTKKEQLIVVIRDLREVFKEIASGERDHLTRLPNRAKCYSDFQIMCSKHHIKQEVFALMTISIDDFLTIQSMLGHHMADKAVTEVAGLLKQLSILHGYHLYHLAYANFMLIFPDVSSNDDLFKISKTIQERTSMLYQEHRTDAYLTATIGIATTSDSGGPTTSLFSKSHQALIEARKYGINNIYLYKESKQKHDFDDSALQHDIQYAIERDELVIYYQPIVDGETHKVVAAEALMRWKHPEKGLIPPFIFIPIMEKTGFIVEAGKYLIEEVISQQAKWKLFNFEEIVVSLNASIREIESPDYAKFISEMLKKYSVAPSTIKIEITESLAVNNIDKMLQYLNSLRGTGVTLSLDDFGTGYTSFAYLTKIPASTLKIDKSFIDNILTDKKSQQVVRAILEVGHALEMNIVAEGVEKAEMAELLHDYGCDYLQGYYFSKPVPKFEMQGNLTPKKGVSDIINKDGTDIGEIMQLHPV